MNGEKATVNNIKVGTLLKCTVRFGQQWAESIIKGNPKMDHLKVIKVYGNGHVDIFYVNVIDKNGRNLGYPLASSQYIAAGYSGKYDCEIYEPITYSIDNMLKGLDLLAEKIK